jgi:hypothetical protein
LIIVGIAGPSASRETLGGDDPLSCAAALRGVFSRDFVFRDRLGALARALLNSRHSTLAAGGVAGE